VEGGILNAVSRAVAPQAVDTSTPNNSTFSSPRNTLSSTTGFVVAIGQDASVPSHAPPEGPKSNALSFDEEAKLVYGIVLSLRNVIKKLSGRYAVFLPPSVLHGLDRTHFARDELFTSYRTSAYRLHLYETISGYKFVCLSDPSTDGLRFVLRQIYSGPFVNFVVRNPLVPMDSREQGIDNDYFRASVDRLIRGLSVFA
jgi:hypothetical protein